MKKLIIVIFMLIVILAGKNDYKEFSLLNYFSGEYTVYTSSQTGNDCVDLGFCYMNTKPVTDNVIGESIVVENLEVAAAITSLNAHVVSSECLEDGTSVIYAYTNLIKDKVQVNGKNVNLQIAVRDEKTIIGWPLIMGSF